MEKRYTMSQKEIKRLEIIQKIESKQLKQKQGAEILSVSVRQVQRLLYAYKKTGPEGLISKKRGKPSNNQLPESTKEMAVFLIKKHYHDFGPTLAAEKLAERHELFVSVETARKLMMEGGIWVPRSHKAKRAFQPRYRRKCFGELIQIDGSDHDWFEGRSDGKCTLLVYVDDATSKLMDIRFVPSESTFTYFEITQKYVLKYGKPIAFYSDKYGVFRVNAKEAKGGKRITQFGRALLDLNIDLINANTCQAKGRVERANKTLQDRLIKEMRLRGISSMAEGNAFIPEFIEDYNRRFGKPASENTDMHRPLNDEGKSNLEDIFCWQEERTVSQNLTIQYNKRRYIIEDTLKNRKLRRGRVMVHDYYNGEVKIKHKGQELKYTNIWDRLEQHVTDQAIVDNKHLDAALSFAKMRQEEREPEQRSSKSPRRRHLEGESSLKPESPPQSPLGGSGGAKGPLNPRKSTLHLKTTF